MRRLRRWSLVLLAAVLLTACAGSERTGTDAEPGVVAPEPPVDSGGEGGAEEPALDDDGAVVDADRDVVLRAAIDLVVDDTDATVDAIRSIVDREDGFVASADLRRPEPGNQLAGWLTLRVPSERIDAVIDDIEDLAREVRSRTLASEDVTSQALDLDARLRNLRALESELRALLTEVRGRAGGNADELLAVFDRISQTRGEIERLESQRAELAERVDLATITVTLIPSEAATPLASQWSPAEIARRAARTLVAGLRGIASGLIWFGVVGLPILAAASVLGGGAWLWIRRRRRRRMRPPADDEVGGSSDRTEPRHPAGVG